MSWGRKASQTQSNAQSRTQILQMLFFLSWCFFIGELPCTSPALLPNLKVLTFFHLYTLLIRHECHHAGSFPGHRGSYKNPGSQSGSWDTGCSNPGLGLHACQCCWPPGGQGVWSMFWVLATLGCVSFPLYDGLLLLCVIFSFQICKLNCQKTLFSHQAGKQYYRK